MATETTLAIAALPGGDTVWATWRRGRGEAVTGEGVFGPDKDIAAALPDKKAAKAAVLALPSNQMIMRVLAFPVADADELSAMAVLQVDKFSPFPLDQMVVSHEVLAQQDGHSIVLAAAARISVVNEAGQRLATEHGIGISRVDALLLGRWHTLRAAGALEHNGRETLVLIDDAGIDVLTHESGIPVGFSGLGYLPPENDAANADELVQEIVHLLMGVEADRGPDPQAIITVWSGERDVSALVDALGDRVQWVVRERSLGSIPSAISGVAERAGAAGSQQLDLTPPAWRETEDAQRFRRRMMATVGVLLGGWLLLAAASWGLLAWQRARVTQLQAAELSWLEPANAVRRLRMQAQLIQRYMDRRTSALECLREISLLQPPGVDLASFTYRKGEGLELVGEADSGALVIRYNEALNASALFETVKAGPRTLTNKQRHRFSFEITFKKEEP